MKKILLVIFVICNFFWLNSQTWAWARAPKGSGNTEGTAVATDPSGNAFTTGIITNATLTFGSTTLTTTGDKIFLAKYDPNGNALWAKTSTGTSNEISWAVTTDASGNSYITGQFFPGTATFGSTTFTNTNSTNIGDIFLVKYDVNGNVLWARSAGGTGNESGRGVCTDASGNVIITGEFGSPSITFGTYTLTNSGARSVFVAKYDMNGNVLWAKNSVGTGWDMGFSVSTNTLGDIFVAGVYDGSTTSFGTYTLTNLNNITPKEDMFITKYSPSGNVLWASNSASSMNYDKAYSVSADPLGNSYVTGYYNGNPVNQFSKVFTSKYDANGNNLWTKYSSGSSGSNGDIGYSVKSFTGGVFISGGMAYTSITFGPFTHTISPFSYLDPVFITQYDQNGNVQYSTFLLSGGDDNHGIDIDNNCNLYLASDFGLSSYIIGSDTLANTGGESLFLAKLNYSCQGPQGIMNINEMSGSLMLYPNPAATVLNIKTTSLQPDEIQIVNTIGEVILKQKYSENIDISGLQSGYYIVRIGNYYSRLIKE